MKELFPLSKQRIIGAISGSNIVQEKFVPLFQTDFRNISKNLSFHPILFT